MLPILSHRTQKQKEHRNEEKQKIKDFGRISQECEHQDLDKTLATCYLLLATVHDDHCRCFPKMTKSVQ